PDTYEIDPERHIASQPHLIYNRNSPDEYFFRGGLDSLYGLGVRIAAPSSITSLPLVRSEVQGEFANYSSFVQAGGNVNIV
ncbi:hypothetical protein, partial [Escherichia coli]